MGSAREVWYELLRGGWKAQDQGEGTLVVGSALDSKNAEATGGRRWEWWG